MRCRLFRDLACVPALCQPNVELACGAKRRQLRALAAKRSDVLAAMERTFAEEIARVTTRLASIACARTGSVGFPQRFGSSLNVHVHFHTLAIDGVFEKTAMGVRFHDAPPPSKDDVSEVARRVRERALLWLRRRGYLDERAAEERSNETIEPSALDACTQLALAGGAYLARPFEHKDSPDAAFERRERRFSAACDGFDVHCAVRIAANDDQGRERLVRYCSRPAFALDRIELLPDGRIASTLISVLHWGRLLEGELFATSRYVEWAVLMKRSFGFDALRCPRCERRMRVLSTITDSAVVRRILDHLNLPSQPRTAAPARDPTWEPMALGFDAA
ncbi:transposase [Sorangium sp. So ce145]|uniref:transposase n=1 Tax=Sorangium sp. So ce145 TaxID=3133285 RepID=UPI003F5E7CD3